MGPVLVSCWVLEPSLLVNINERPARPLQRIGKPLSVIRINPLAGFWRLILTVLENDSVDLLLRWTF